MGGNDAYRKILQGFTRREFLYVSSLAAAGAIAGCATDPVTGKSQLMLVSEEQEIQLDRHNSPLQFSSDYGILQDKGLNDYVGEVGRRLLPYTHRPHMPYRLVGVNATYINAYAFPGEVSPPPGASSFPWTAKPSWLPFWATNSGTSTPATRPSKCPRGR